MPSRLFHCSGRVSARPVRPVSLPSFSSCTEEVLMSPLPEPSTTSTILGRPSGVVCRPGAPGSTPVSNTATTTPRPSYSGCALRKASAPVSRFGIRAENGRLIVAPGRLGSFLSSESATVLTGTVWQPARIIASMGAMRFIARKISDETGGCAMKIVVLPAYSFCFC